MQASAANPCLESRHRRCGFHKTRCYPAGANTQAKTKCKQIKQASTQHPFSNMQTPPNAVAVRMQLSQPQLWRCLEPNRPRDAFCNPSRRQDAFCGKKATSGCDFAIPVSLGMRFLRHERLQDVILQPQSASGCDFAARTTSGCDFATPVGHGMRFCSSGDLGMRFCSPDNLGMRFCNPSRPRDAFLQPRRPRDAIL